MVDVKTATEIRRRAIQGICYFKGCDKPGKSRIQQTFAEFDPEKGRTMQVVVNAWACDNYEHRGGR